MDNILLSYKYFLLEKIYIYKITFIKISFLLILLILLKKNMTIINNVIL